MNSNSNSFRDRRLHEAVQKAMRIDWDPIGVKDVPEASDEYDAYVTDVCRILEEGTKEELLSYLWWLETEHMGMSGDRDHTEWFTDRLMEISSELEWSVDPN